MTAPWIETASLADCTILIVQNDLENYGPLQGRISGAGGKVMATDSLARALLIARNGALDDAVIEFDFAGAAEVVEVLKERHVRYVFCAAASLPKLAATACEAPCLKSAEQ